MRYSALFLFIAIVSMSILGCDWINPNEPVEPVNNTVEMVLPQESDVMFTGNEDHLINLLEAEAMMSAFQASNPNKAYAWFFGKKAIETLIAQDGCVGIRIYGGLTNEGKYSPVLVGVTTDGKDIRGAEGLQKVLKDSVIMLEFSIPCPPYCPTPP